jgi:hypothetical protein
MNRRRFPLCSWLLSLSLPLRALPDWQLLDGLPMSTAFPCWQ